MAENEETKQPKRGERFDIAAAQDAARTLNELVARHPEMRGALVVFDWAHDFNDSSAIIKGATSGNAMTAVEVFGLLHNAQKVTTDLTAYIRNLNAALQNEYMEIAGKLAAAKKEAATAEPPAAPGS